METIPPLIQKSKGKYLINFKIIFQDEQLFTKFK